MRNKSAFKLLSPPARLRPIPRRWARLLRPLWFLLFLFAVLADIAGAFYVVRDAYQFRPAFSRLGLDYEVQYRGEVRVGVLPGEDGRTGIEIQSRIVAIDGLPVDRDERISGLVERLETAPGPIVSVDLRHPDGSTSRLQQRRSDSDAEAAAVTARDVRITVRLVLALVACASLLLCSFILALRRPADPVAMLFAFAFAGMAATIDPPLQMWMGLGLATLSDIVSGFWFYLLMIALAVFPDGIFIPRPYRWLIPAGVPLAIFLSLPDVSGTLQVFLGLGVLMAMLVGQVRRFRRLSPGIERQQIKWAAFGFAAGLLLLFVAFILVAQIPDEPSRQDPLLSLAALAFFSLGMAVLPLGLIVALARFRLWEADTIITRSAAYAVVTVIVGVVWAASADLVKLVISEALGRNSEAGATTIGAIIAAGIFSPTQSLVLGWTRRHFGGPLDRIAGVSERLKAAALTDTPAEVASLALDLIDNAVHPSASAVVRSEDGELIAARGANSSDDPALIERLELVDEKGTLGTLLLGRRSDGNRYNRQQLEAVRQILPTLAEGLRIAASRHSREATMQQRIEEMAARLAQLEGGTPKPA